jgi:hypothetical protein
MVSGYLIGLGTGPDEFKFGAVHRWRPDLKPLKVLASGGPASAEPVRVRVRTQPGGKLLVQAGTGPEVAVVDADGYPGGRIGLAAGPGGKLEVTRLAVRPGAGAAVPPTPLAEPGFTTLVSPDSLAGWEVEGDDPGAEVIGNVVHLRAPAAEDGVSYAHLLTGREYGDFALKFEYRFAKGAVGLVCVRAVPGETLASRDGRRVPAHPMVYLSARAPEPGKPAVVIPVELRSWHAANLRLTPLKPKGESGEPQADTWHTAEVLVRGPALALTLDGNPVLHRQPEKPPSVIDLPDFPAGRNRRTGRLGFSASLGQVQVRNVRVKDLSAP